VRLVVLLGPTCVGVFFRSLGGRVLLDEFVLFAGVALFVYFDERGVNQLTAVHRNAHHL
jgi:hypothetical protein